MKCSLFFFTAIFSLIASSSAEAGCRNNKPICGSTDICHSDRRAKNVNDLKQPVHPRLCTALNNMVKKFGKIEILSAYRSNNAKRGGAEFSMHLQKAGGPSLAVDVYRPADRGSMYQFLGNQQCQDKQLRYNIYCGTGTVHMDMNILGRRNNTNYSRCSSFFRVKCGAGGQDDDGGGYVSPKVEEYKAKPRRNISQCYKKQTYGTCCGPIRRAKGLCR